MSSKPTPQETIAVEGTGTLPKARRRFRWSVLTLILVAVVAGWGFGSVGSAQPASGTGEGSAEGTGSPSGEGAESRRGVSADVPGAIRFAAQEAAEPSAPGEVVARHVRVATKPFAPFVFETNGRFSGFSIDLWDKIAEELGITYEWVGTTTVSELLDTVREGTADVAIAGITITAEREDTMDFTHAFFQSGLQVLIPAEGGDSSVLGVIFSLQFLKMIGLLFVILYGAANVLWILERRKNPDMFPKTYLRGVWEAFWWSAVTITTVGYGDKTPKSAAGRVVAILWMFAGLIFLGFFTASVTTILTVEQLAGNIGGPEDLPGRRVGTVGGTTAADFLYAEGARVAEFTTVDDAYEALIGGRVEAVVYDSPALLYYSSHDGIGRVRVVGPLFMEQSYGIALPTGSDLREAISLALLSLRENGGYAEVYTSYFGE